MAFLRRLRRHLRGGRLPEFSPGGSRIYRHTNGTAPRVSHGDGDLIAAVSAHIERFVGEPETVLHQVVSSWVHVDLHVVPPTDERPWTTLVTSGMSQRAMRAPDAGCTRAELIMALPPTWPLEHSELADDRVYWPFRLLQTLATFPHQYKTWLWTGHTIPHGDPPEPYADDTELCCSILLPPLLVGPGFDVLEFGDRRVRFLGVYPLYEPEMRLKLESGYEALIDRFDAAGVSELLDPDRPSVVLSRFRPR
jgi:Suppressor of fused protein (SUFU)